VRPRNAAELPGLTGMLVNQVRYHLSVLLRTPRALSTGLVVPVLLLLLSNTKHGQLPAARLAGPAILGLTMTAWTTHGITLIAAREAGVLKRWRATPLPAWCYFTARIVATVVVAVLAAVITVVVGAEWFGSSVPPRAVVAMATALVVGATACAALATAVTGIVPNVASAFPILGLSYLPVVLISGVLGSMPSEPSWLTTLASYLPVQPIIDATTHAVQHGSLVLRDLLVLMGWTIGGLLAALGTFRWAPTRPRQRRAAARS
jgi:ABC-2 type transport system permease protein